MLDTDSNFIALYKAKPPFIKNERGFGYMGVVLQDVDSGKIQCHVCGALVNSIYLHLRWSHRGMDGKSYRQAFGLNIKVPLISETFSQNMRNTFFNLPESKKEEVTKRLQKNAKDAWKNPNKRKVRKSKGSIQFQNQFSTCNLQAKERFWKHYESFGRIPTTEEIDKGLVSVIYKRFGTYEKALKEWGVDDKEIKTHFDPDFKQKKAFEARKAKGFFKIYDKETVRKQLLASIKDGQLPSWREIERTLVPGRTTIYKLFGSYRKKEILKKVLNP